MRRRLLLVPLLLLPLVVPVLVDHASADVAATDGQSTYVPVAPRRVLDTRNGTGHSGAVGQRASIDLALGLPSGATAAVLNVTATRATTPTVIRVYPTDTTTRAVPQVSNLNVPAGRTVADLVVTKLGSSGNVRFYNGAGSVQLVADLAGYYVTGGAQAGFHGTAPVRLLDTRTAKQPLAPGAPRTVDPRTAADGSATGVPDTATAVAVTLTAVAPTTDTVLRAYPSGGSVPTVSNLDPSRGAIVANLADVQLGGGTFDLLNGAGRTDVVVDLVGWYTPGDGDVFHPLDPYRALDTRDSTAVAAGSPRSLALAGAGQVPWSATSLAVTLTAVAPGAATYLTLYPAVHGSTTAPTASTLNAPAGADVPSAAVVSAGDEGQVRIKNAASTTDVLLDVAGWFGPAGEGYDISWPQCSSNGTSSHPATAADAVIGLTDGKPYTDNPCLADEFAWANSLPGGGSGYIILNSPGTSDANWGARRTPKACDGSDSAGCAYDYGWWASDHALQALPTTRTGGRPQVWLDVEGPYASGPTWDSSQAVNAATISGARDRLRAAGVRTGVYSRQRTTSSSGTRTDDWWKLTGGLALAGTQQWVFTAKDEPSAAALCLPSKAFTTGSVLLSQYQTQVAGTTYDTDHTC